MDWSRVFNAWAVVWLAAGAAVAILSVGVPELSGLLWTDKAAAWASAVGTFAAAAVALNLGLAESRHRKQTDLQRAQSAATVFNENLGMLQTFVFAVRNFGLRATDEELTGGEVVMLSREAEELRPIIEDRFATLIADLPPGTARLVVLADLRFRNFLANDAVFEPGKYMMRREIAFNFASDVALLGEAVASASRAVQELVAPGFPPAWMHFISSRWKRPQLDPG